MFDSEAIRRLKVDVDNIDARLTEFVQLSGVVETHTFGTYPCRSIQTTRNVGEEIDNLKRQFNELLEVLNLERYDTPPKSGIRKKK